MEHAGGDDLVRVARPRSSCATSSGCRMKSASSDAPPLALVVLGGELQCA